MNINSAGQTCQGGNAGEMVYWESQYFFPFNELFPFPLVHTQYTVLLKKIVSNRIILP